MIRNAIGAFVALLVSFLAFPRPASAETRPDAYLAGYVSSVLENDLAWEGSTFSVWVRDGMVVVTADRPESDLAKARTRLARVAGLRRLDVLAGETELEASPGLFQKFIERVLSVEEDIIYFPSGDVFRPLIADPKEPSFFVSLRHYDSANIDGVVGAVGYGGTFGLLRRPGSRPGNGFQVGLGGGLFAQFDLESDSNDLINADYTVGMPVSYRYGRMSYRARVYHQSSHLGDEFLLRRRPERQNLTFESLELLAAADVGQGRFYGGGEFILSRQPSSFDRGILSGGFDFIGARPMFGIGRPVLAVGLKSVQESHWNVGLTGLVGVQFGAANTPDRTLRFVVEGFTGKNPHGQFYQDKADYLGVGMYLGF